MSSVHLGQQVPRQYDNATLTRIINALCDQIGQASSTTDLTNTRIANVGAVFDGGGSAPTSGTKVYVVCPYAGAISGWDISADLAGNVVVDVWKAAGAIPSVANTIAGTEKPTLTAAQLASDTSLTTWTTTVTAGDVFGFNLDSAATSTRITVQLRIAKT